MSTDWILSWHFYIQRLEYVYLPWPEFPAATGILTLSLHFPGNFQNVFNFLWKQRIQD